MDGKFRAVCIGNLFKLHTRVIGKFAFKLFG
ncbi:hypothetical protein GGP86_002732 [Salinibacter ruber]|nr:hypothetical protein [Salinibacter ruber]